MAYNNRIFDDLLDTYKRTSNYRDDVIRGVGLHRDEYEHDLDEMWRIYCSGNMMQVIEYKKLVNYIKDAGFTVKRSKSTGKHKIV